MSRGGLKGAIEKTKQGEVEGNEGAGSGTEEKEGKKSKF